MQRIQNLGINTTTQLNKTIVGCVCVLAVTAIVIAIIGLTASTDSPFNAIVDLCSATNRVILDISIAVLILDLFLIVILCKKSKPAQKKISFSRTSPPQINAKLDRDASTAIFSYLSAHDLARSCRISKQWHTLASQPILWDKLNLKKISPLLQVFDEADWAKHVDLSSLGLSVADAPKLDKYQQIPAIMRLLSSLSIEKNSGVTLLTMPKGFTLRKLVELTGPPNSSSEPRMPPNVIVFIPLRDGTIFGGGIWRYLAKENRDIPVDKTYRIVITNNILSGSRNLSFLNHEKMVHNLGCEIPKALEVVTLIALTYIRSQQSLYASIPSTYTYCSEKFRGQYGESQVKVAGGGVYNKNIDIDLSTANLTGCSQIGISAILKL